MDYQELELAGIDVAEMLERFMNNTGLTRMIVGKFLSDKTYMQLKEAVERGDMKDAEFACHSLKGVSGNLSLKKLFELTQEQLRLFRAGETTAAAAMMDKVTAEYEAAVHHLRLWLDQQ